MHELDIMMVLVGVLVVALTLLSGRIEGHLYFSGSMIALCAGVLIGPRMLDWLDPAQWGDPRALMEGAARLTIGVTLMDVALRLPPRYFRRHWRMLALLYGVVTPLMAATGGLLLAALAPIPFWLAMLVGSIAAPTDPVVASSIVTGRTADRNLPARLRQVLSAESGGNDGLAYPFVVLTLLLATHPAAFSLSHWLLYVVLWQIGGAIATGIVLGAVAGWLLAHTSPSWFIERPWRLAYAGGLSILALGTAHVLRTDGILAPFAAGLVLRCCLADSNTVAEEQSAQSMFSIFFTLPLFALLGLMLPWNQWAKLGWRSWTAVILVVLLRRLPIVLALKPVMRAFHSWSDALFAGWFGPIGVGAVFYAVLAVGRGAPPIVWTLASLAVACSVVIHGMSATPLLHLYRRAHGPPESLANCEPNEAVGNLRGPRPRDPPRSASR